MPLSRSAHLVLDEGEDTLRLALWRILSDLELWRECTGERERLFAPGTPPVMEWVGDAQLAGAIRALWLVVRDPGRAVPFRLAEACAEVWDWAERRDLKETALQFAEMAARLDPDNPARCSTAGRLSRRSGEPNRGTMWYRRGARLARMQDDDAAFAIAQLGWSNLEQDLGHLDEAEFHAAKAYRAALRVGRRSDAAYAFHALCTILIHQERFEEAWAHAQNALVSYPVLHPRFPAFAHDVAFLMARVGHHSSALPVLLQVLPFIERSNERLVVLANVARAAAASGHRVYFERAAAEVWKAIDADGELPPSALYHLAEAYRTYELWDRAGSLAKRALSSATGLKQQIIVTRATQLLDKIASKIPGDEDALAEPGSEVDTIRETLLRKLRKHTAPGSQPGAVPPEKYPIT